MTIAKTGNRQGTMPARMVGQNLCSEARVLSTDAGGRSRFGGFRRVGIASSASREVHGRTSLTIFVLSLLTLSSFANAEVVAQPKRESAKLSQQPLQMKRPMLPTPVEPPPTAEELTAAKGIEAMFVELLVQELRKSVPENEYMPASHAEKIFQQMLDSEYARAMTEGNQLGISELVLAQMRRKR